MTPEHLGVTPERHLVIGTAGHVDHGKTALIRALTGHHTDRLPEEQARGISIDLGFAHFVLPSGQRAAVIDVPGHERFVHNMLAGAVGIDVALLVVAADEGVMPQTAEHIAILDLLGLHHGLIALTKADLVDAEWLELVHEAVREAVAGTFLAEAPMLAVSSVTGDGVPELAAALAGMYSDAQSRDAAGVARLPVDRVFTRPGFGTVVTGTLSAGRIALDDRLELLPAGTMVRVRGLQVHGQKVESATAGQRVAVNLQGIEHHQVRRGYVLAQSGSLQPGQVFAGSLRLLPSASARLRHGAPVHLHVGTAETVARVVLLGQDELQPGASGYALLRCEKPVTVARQDRFVIRSYSPVTTIGGGVVLEPHAAFRRSSQSALAALQRLEAGGPATVLTELLRQTGPQPVRVTDLAKRAALTEAVVRAALTELVDAGEAVAVDTDSFLHASGLAAVTDAIKAYVTAAAAKQPLLIGVPREQLRRQTAPGFDGRLFGQLLEQLQGAGALTLQRDRVSPGGERPPLPEQLDRAVNVVAAALQQGGLAPPGPDALAAEVKGLLPAGASILDVLQYLAALGTAVGLDDNVWLHEEAVRAAANTVSNALAAEGEATMSVLRDKLGTSRKYAVPLLEYMDKQGITRRHGDVRRLGPAATSTDDIGSTD